MTGALAIETRTARPLIDEKTIICETYGSIHHRVIKITPVELSQSFANIEESPVSIDPSRAYFTSLQVLPRHCDFAVVMGKPVLASYRLTSCRDIYDLVF